MTAKTILRLTVPAALVLCAGLSPILPVKAQDDPPEAHVKGRIIIKTGDGEQVLDFDPSQLPPPGEGANIFIVRKDSNGEISTFASSPDMMNMGTGNGGGLAYNLPGSGPGNTSIAVIDPGVSYVYALLKRTDIGTEIRLNARQREALEAAETSQQQARQDQIKQAVQGITLNIQGQNSDELKTAMMEQAQKVKAMAQGFTDSRLKTLATILRPEQLARLKELDLQYRGPLAMGVHDVAELATLNADLAGKVSGLLKEYRQEVTKNLPNRTRMISFKPGSAPPPAEAAPNSEEMRGKLVKADKEIRKSRQVLGAKALATLPDAQRAQWSKLTGKPFEFHPAL